MSDDASEARRRGTDALERALVHARAWLDGLDRRPLGASVDADTLRARLGGPVPVEGTDAAEVIDTLVAGAEGGHLGTGSGRFFGWVIGGCLPSALAADWLTSTWDDNATLHASAPAAAVVEEIAGAWMLELLELPPAASFAFTTGCQMAHFTCLAAARHAVLARHGHDVVEHGLLGGPELRVVVSAERHPSIDRALRFLGLGRRHVHAVATSESGTILRADFERALRGERPTIVVLDAADLNVAAFDAFAELIPLAHDAGAWVHIDGAFGLMARVSRAKRALLEGVELADSWATDFHKWLNVPFDSGFAIVRDRDAHRASLAVEAAYLPAGRGVRDPLDFTPEWSRRARGFAVYAALRELGRAGLEAIVDRSCRHAGELVTRIGALEGAEVVFRSELNQGLVRFRSPRAGASEAEHDAFTDRVIETIVASGEAFFGGTDWRGRRAMRVSVVSWKTDDRDVARAVAAVGSALAACARRGGET